MNFTLIVTINTCGIRFAIGTGHFGRNCYGKIFQTDRTAGKAGISRILPGGYPAGRCILRTLCRGRQNEITPFDFIVQIVGGQGISGGILPAGNRTGRNGQITQHDRLPVALDINPVSVRCHTGVFR